jgi:hypothetical protein
MDAPVRYLEELRTELGLYPTWLPGDPIELGAFGTIVRGQFVADGRLADLGIEVEPGYSSQEASFEKHRGMTLKAASQTSAKLGWIDAELGVNVEVAREHAWVFAAHGMTKVEIRNIHEVRRHVLEARKAGAWQRDWLLVSEVRRVDRLTVLVARSKHAKGKIRGKAMVEKPYEILLQEEASFELSTDDLFMAPCIKNATPLYGLRRLQGLLDPQLGVVRSGGDGGYGDDDDLLSLEVANNEPFFR